MFGGAFAFLPGWRNRIQSPPAKRLTTQQTPDCQPGPPPEAVNPQRFDRITGTGRLETATVRQQRGNGPLIDPDDCNQHSGGDSAGPAGINPALANRPAISRVTSCRLYFSMRRRGIRTSRTTGRYSFNSRKLSQHNRRARLRFTESRLYFLPHITPHRRRSSGAGAYTSSIPGPTSLVPSSRT